MISMEEDSPFLSAFGMDSAAGARLVSGVSSSNAASPEIAAYLSQLSSFGLERLTREPERLAEEKGAILEQTKELASQNYKTFIETAECSKEIFEDFVEVENRLGNLLERKLPLCSERCKDFQKQAEQMSEKRRLNNQILQKHAQLLEILEIPQLIDTCVKNGHFDEALELANYIRRLEKKHGTQIPLVRSILVEVRNCIQSMVGQLISQLRTAQLTLPVCLKVIGHIRRLDAFTETELRVLFLNARDSWFQNTLASIPKDDAYNHVIKTVDATRVHLFDIVTQYKAIFTDDAEVRPSAKRVTAGVASFQSNDSSILYSWILEKVEAFLRTLTTDLASPSVEQRLDAIFNQCMYFGLSFGRVGIDLRPLLVPIFEEASLRFLTLGLNRGLKAFEDELKLLSFTSSHLGVTSGSNNAVLAMSFDLSADLESSSTSPSFGGSLVASNQPPPPPLSLLEFPPLASLYNDILNVLNDFRPTATLDALFPTKEAVVDHLEAAGRICVAVFDSLKNSFTESEADNFRRLCLLFVDTLVPNVVKCFKCFFPSQLIAEALGVGIGEVHKSKVFGIDVGRIRSVFDKETFPNLVESDVDDAIDDSKTGEVGFGSDLSSVETVESAFVDVMEKKTEAPALQLMEAEEPSHDPQIGELPHVPQVKELSHSPQVEELSHSPQVEELSHAPQVEELSPVPHVEELSHVPQVEELPHVPQVKELSHSPQVEELSHAPQVEELSHAPQVEELSHVPQVEELFHVPQVEELSHVPQVEELSHVSQVEELSQIPQAEKLSHVPLAEELSLVLLAEELPHVPQVEELPYVLQVEELPHVLQVEELPHVPQVELTEVPQVEELTDVPQVEELIHVPQVEELAHVPQVEELHVPQVQEPHVSQVEEPHVSQVEALPHIPQVVELTHVPQVEGLPHVPQVEGLPHVPQVEELPHVPQVEEFPHVPQVEEFPRVPQVEELPDVPQVEELPDVPLVEELPDVSQIEELPDASQVEELPDASQVEELPDASQVEELPDVSLVEELPDVSQVEELHVPHVEELSHVSQVKELAHVPQVEELSNVSQVEGLSHVSQVEGLSHVPQANELSLVPQAKELSHVTRVEELDLLMNDYPTVDQPRTLGEESPAAETAVSVDDTSSVPVDNGDRSAPAQTDVVPPSDTGDTAQLQIDVQASAFPRN